MFLFGYNMHHLHMDSHYLHRYIQQKLGFKNMIKTNIILIPEVRVYFFLNLKLYYSIDNSFWIYKIMAFSLYKPSFLIKIEKQIKTELLYTEYSLDKTANSW